VQEEVERYLLPGLRCDSSKFVTAGGIPDSNRLWDLHEDLRQIKAREVCHNPPHPPLSGRNDSYTTTEIGRVGAVFLNGSHK